MRRGTIVAVMALGVAISAPADASASRWTRCTQPEFASGELVTKGGVVQRRQQRIKRASDGVLEPERFPAVRAADPHPRVGRSRRGEVLIDMFGLPPVRREPQTRSTGTAANTEKSASWVATATP